MADFDPNSIDGNDTAIKGGTDNSIIGNVGDSLKVVATFSSATTTVPSWSKKLRYEDMNATTGGIARNTSLSGGTWTQLYYYTGSGFLAGIVINMETFSTGWELRLTVDGEVIYTLLDTDISSDKLYDLDDINDFNQSWLGVSKGSHDRFIWHPPLTPLYYGSSIKFEIRKNGGAKKWQAGLIILSKET